VQRADDVFWLTVQELGELARSRPDDSIRWRQLISERAEAHKIASAVTPPDSFVLR